MGFARPYPVEDRLKQRAIVKRLEKLHVQLQEIAEGKRAPNSQFQAAMAVFTGRSDLGNQLEVMAYRHQMAERLHFERLKVLAPDDLACFAEAMNMAEPPPRHLMYLSEQLMRVESGEIDRLLLSMPPGHAKDLDVETPVMMGDGTFRRLGDVTTGDMVITAQARPREVIAVHDQGVRPVLKLTTAQGRIIRAHPDHLFLTPGDWVPAKELRPGMVLALPREIATLPRREPVSAARRPEWVFAGYMMARAAVTGRTYNRIKRVNRLFRCDDPAILADFKACCDVLGFPWKHQIEEAYGKKAIKVTLGMKAKDWLEERGLYEVTKEHVRVPDWVFAGTDKEIAAFLGAIISCDAQFVPTIHRQTPLQRQIEMTIIKNEGLARDLQRLFLRIGVSVEVYCSKSSNYNYDAVTFWKLKVKDATNQSLIARRCRIVGASARIWALPLVGVSFGSETFHEDKVVEVVPDGTAVTRCLTVDEDASFLADGVVVHNSTYGSRYMPAWHLGRRENRKFLQAGHTQDFVAKEFGKKTRDIVGSPAYREVFPGVVIRSDSTAADNWRLNNGGEYIAKGVGQGIAGVRSTFNAVDDPYKDWGDAQSPLVRQTTWDWFAIDFMSRLLPLGKAIIIMCLTGDTPVHMADGTTKPMRDVEAGDRVLAWKDGTLVERAVTKASLQGEDAVYEIRTKGSLVRANARHPFLVRRPDGSVEWVRTIDLEPGDDLVQSGVDPRPSEPAVWSVDEAWAYGYLFGDGWVTVNRKRNKNPNGKTYETASWITCVADCPAYPDRVKRCVDFLAKTFDARFVKTKFGYYRSEKAVMGRALHALGIGAGAKGKRVPPMLFRQPEAIREAFLAGFMAADGAVSVKGNYAVTKTLLANEALVGDLRHLARTLGYPVTNVTKTVHPRKAPNAKGVVDTTAWHFAFHHGKKSEEVFSPSRIRSIKEVGRADVYDITVDDAETFIADGLVTHNTRWHLDDICGRIIDGMKDGTLEDHWEIINLPAIHQEEEPDILGRHFGEFLWPEYYTPEDMKRRQNLVGPIKWSCLYLGDPLPSEGTILKRNDFVFTEHMPMNRAGTLVNTRSGENSSQNNLNAGKIYSKAGRYPSLQVRDPAISGGGPSKSRTGDPQNFDEEANILAYFKTVLSVDSAETETARSDFSAITVWRPGIDGRHYLMDAERGRWAFPKLVEAIDRMAKTWGADLLLMETKGAGIQYIQAVSNLGKAPCEVVPITPGPKQSKVFRMDGASLVFQQHRVVFPKRAVWLPDLERELLEFPGSKHDDYADSVSQYINWAQANTVQPRGSVKMKGTGASKR